MAIKGIRRLVIFAIGLTALGVAATGTRAQTARSEIEAIIKDYIDQHPDEIGAILKDYLAKNPEMLQQALIEMMKRRGSPGGQTANTKLASADKSAAIKDNAELLFNSNRQVTIGNPQGDVTLVEFFDYNCGYCKRALSDTISLLKDDPKLRIILKEYPILGQGSAEAAIVGTALRMQDPSGEKYLAFHEKLFGGRGPANRQAALWAAQEAGADMAKLETDANSEEITKSLAESRLLGQSLGVSGTPAYVVGNAIVPGAIGAEALKRAIRQARQ